MKSDIVEAVEPVVDALVSLGVDYRIGGSVASSALGVPRTTLDVDLVCRLRPGDVASFVRALEGTYYVDGEMIRDAIGREASFNVIHLATMIKVDVFIAKSRPWDQVAFARHVHKPLDVEPGARAFELTTAEDIVLHKLEWYRLGGDISERQWKAARCSLGARQLARPRLPPGVGVEPRPRCVARTRIERAPNVTAVRERAGAPSGKA